MEELIARIFIQTVQGAEVVCLYNTDAFDLLELDEEPGGFHYRFLEIGKEFGYEGSRYVVRQVNFRMHQEMTEMDPDIGVNMYSPTEPTNHNCQIGVFVERIN